VKSVGAYRHVLSGGGVTLYTGDFFKLPPAPQFTRVWDRASLVALDPATRVKYVATITNALAPGGVILLQTLHRVAGPPEALAGGPPFSVSDDDIRALYARCGSSGQRGDVRAICTLTCNEALLLTHPHTRRLRACVFRHCAQRV
jgi:hypothetical protein